MRGNLNDINTALSGLIFIPKEDFAKKFSIKVTVDDEIETVQRKIRVNDTQEKFSEKTYIIRVKDL